MDEHRQTVVRFLDSQANTHTLALVYGRRRIGKTTLLEDLTAQRAGFYWQATRTEPAVQLDRLGGALGEHLGVGRIAFDSWEEALAALLRLGRRGPVPVVLDEFGYVLEADPSMPSVIAAALDPAGQRANPGQARLILCGSAIAMMQELTAGQAPLRGRAGLELIMQAADFRTARRWLPAPDDLDLAAHVYAVIGGVIGYATAMVDHDLPDRLGDFDRWVAERVLSPASPLHHEATTLLAEDPSLTGTSPTLHHAVLGAIATGSVTVGTIANALRRRAPNLDPALKRLIAAGFVVRHEDPARDQRPTYALADPLLQFHYAVLDPHRQRLRDRDPRGTWQGSLRATFDWRVRGPVFEEQARLWVRRHAAAATLGGTPARVGPSRALVDGPSRELDVVAATDEPTPSQRTILAVGEAKAGETVGLSHLDRLEAARASFGPRAASARLLLVAPDADSALAARVEHRADVELIDLPRLYHGE